MAEPTAVSHTEPLDDLTPLSRRALRQRLQSLLDSGVQQLPAVRLPVAATQPSAGVTQSAGVPKVASQGDVERESVAERRIVPAPHVAAPQVAVPQVSGAQVSGPQVLGPSVPPGQPPSLLVTADPFAFAADRSTRDAALQVLSQEVAECRLCAELARTRKQTVFGTGNPLSRLVFIGEAPGADEDWQGEPFVGRAGQKLNDIIQACGLRREDVYIMNVLKCRPPENRTPTSQEASCCRPFFERQLEILSPAFIVCLGSVAATNLLQTTKSIGGLRGRWHNYRGAQVVVTYHPSYLLRVPECRKQVWEDMKMLLTGMGLPIPTKKSQ